jgi:hypothetical protein
VSGFNDPYPIDLLSKSAEAAGGTSTICIRPFLIHGHGFGWEEVWEIGGFANSVVNDGPQMPRCERPRVDPQDGLVHAKVSGEIKSAVVGFTTAAEWKNPSLTTIPCVIANGEVIASKPLPAGATAFMINASGAGAWGDASVNSPVVWLNR